MDNPKQGENSRARSAANPQQNKGFRARAGILTGQGATLARLACPPIGPVSVFERCRLGLAPGKVFATRVKEKRATSLDVARFLNGCHSQIPGGRGGRIRDPAVTGEERSYRSAVPHPFHIPAPGRARWPTGRMQSAAPSTCMERVLKYP